ncbi:hypothetical protein HPB52_002985 [Rhipicephalus sanguineus]|uniref:Cuticular protein n=1 Tax=Rhipicephalus sanguineus TaxID=34632 RepID=A0A9D4PYG6_RHISA|nr:hypothetical protein HPB52_002985 [Rhipicephalus sanguineus]
MDLYATTFLFAVLFLLQMLLATLLLCAHGARALRPYEPLDEDSNSGIPAVHAAPAFGDGKTPQDDVPTQEDDMMENGNTPLTRQQAYHFSYQIRDADGNSQHHSEQSDVRNNRRGSYGYRDANGLYRHVTYVADRKGFRAWIKTNEPGTTNQEPADVRITAEKPPQKVVDEATSPPAKPNVVADPADAVPARPAVSAVPAFTQPEAVPYHPVHTAGVVAPVPAIDIATGAYPTYDSKRLSGAGYVPTDYSSQSAVPVHDYQRVPEAGVADFEYYPEPQRIQNYADPDGVQGYAYAPQSSYSNQAVPNAVPVYKSIRQFPTLSSSTEKRTGDSGELTEKHGIPVGVTYVNPQDVSRPFDRPQPFDIAPTGVASRYKKYLDWNRQGKLRD